MLSSVSRATEDGFSWETTAWVFWVQDRREQPDSWSVVAMVRMVFQISLFGAALSPKRIWCTRPGMGWRAAAKPAELSLGPR
jgi:hypothetical protein